MIARLKAMLVLVGLLATACAVNPMTPTPQPTATLPPVIVRVATGTATQPPTPTTPPNTATLAPTSSEAQTPATQPPEAPSPTVAVIVQQAVVQATLPPALPPTEAPPVATVIPPVWVAPPVSADVAAAEQYCIELINAQRAAAGLPPYGRDETVMGIARARVADMVARGYRGHNDPVTGASLGSQMIRAAGFRLAGENWYGHRTGPVEIVDSAMAWFMTDPPHAQGILSTGFSVVGVGIAFNGSQWLLIQNFAGS